MPEEFTHSNPVLADKVPGLRLAYSWSSKGFVRKSHYAEGEKPLKTLCALDTVKINLT
jgi:hypothetical protein